MKPTPLAAVPDGHVLPTGNVVVFATDERRIHGRLKQDWQITHLEKDGVLRQLIAVRLRPDLGADWSWYVEAPERRYVEVTFDDLSTTVLFYDVGLDAWFEDELSPKGAAADERLRKIYGPMAHTTKRDGRHNRWPH